MSPCSWFLCSCISYVYAVPFPCPTFHVSMLSLRRWYVSYVYYFILKFSVLYQCILFCVLPVSSCIIWFSCVSLLLCISLVDLCIFIVRASLHPWSVRLRVILCVPSACFHMYPGSSFSASVFHPQVVCLY